jgi:4-hydroxyphenylpyruvate dioxygenase-like putative hemolysin
MSFEEHEDYFIWFCDTEGCDHFAAFKPHDFFACVDELKARGWGFSPPSRGDYEDDWSHKCPKHRRQLGELLKMKFSEVK